MDQRTVYDRDADYKHNPAEIQQIKANTTVSDTMDNSQTGAKALAASSGIGKQMKYIEDIDVVDTYTEPNGVDEETDSLTSEDDGVYLSETTTLIKKLLPPELCNSILKYLWEIAFYPGFIYPHIHMDFDTYICGDKSRYAARPDFLLLTKGVLKDHEERFWSENTIVIGPGYPSYSTDFLDKVPASSCIRKIDLTFTIRDLEENLLYCLPPDHFGWEPYHYYESESSAYDGFVSNSPIREKNGGSGCDDQMDEGCMSDRSDKEYDKGTGPATPDIYDDNSTDWSAWGDHQYSLRQVTHEHNSTSMISTETPQQHDELRNFELRSIWLDKIYNISYLPLTELSLDFFECYGVDGRWMGAEIAACFPSFSCGIPEILRIYAPDLAKRNELESIVRARTP
ncbi:MAG: hypothetical protein LQ343_000462 [Gyalolechia ehrenbergii]|nr:MAG: hypothetical protein LQ343_000462 [Gyalolechia ehrenbergii]